MWSELVALLHGDDSARDHRRSSRFPRCPFPANFRLAENSPTNCQNKLRSDTASRCSRYTISAPCGPMNRLRFILPSKQSAAEFVSVSKLCFRHQIGCSTISSQQVRSDKHEFQ